MIGHAHQALPVVADYVAEAVLTDQAAQLDCNIPVPNGSNEFRFGIPRDL